MITKFEKRHFGRKRQFIFQRKMFVLKFKIIIEAKLKKTSLIKIENSDLHFFKTQSLLQIRKNSHFKNLKASHWKNFLIRKCDKNIQNCR